IEQLELVVGNLKEENADLRKQLAVFRSPVRCEFVEDDGGREAAGYGEAKVQQPQPRPAPTQQQARQPQVDPLAAQRWQLVQQAHALQMSGEEKGIRENAAKWVAWLQTNCPEANHDVTWTYTVQNNPKRAAEINNHFERAKGVFASGLRRIGEI